MERKDKRYKTVAPPDGASVTLPLAILAYTQYKTVPSLAGAAVVKLLRYAVLTSE